MDPSGLAGEHLVEPVDLDHVQVMATGAGGAEDLVAWIRPARPASSWRSASTSITSRGWPPAPAAPSTWWRGSVRRGRRAAGGARRPRSRSGDGHRRRRRRGSGAADPSGAAEQLAERVDLDHIQGMATGAGGAEHLVPRIRPARPSTWWSPSTSITSRGWPSAPAAPSTWCRGSVRPGRRAAGGARRPRSRPGDGHRRRRRRGLGVLEGEGAIRIDSF